MCLTSTKTNAETKNIKITIPISILGIVRVSKFATAYPNTPNIEVRNNMLNALKVLMFSFKLSFFTHNKLYQNKLIFTFVSY